MEVSEERNQQNGFRVMSPRLDDERDQNWGGKTWCVRNLRAAAFVRFLAWRKKDYKTVRGFIYLFYLRVFSEIFCSDMQ